MYKMYQKSKPRDLEGDEDIVDLKDMNAALPHKVRIVRELKIEHLIQSYRTFKNADTASELQHQDQDLPSHGKIYEHEDMPGTVSPSFPFFQAVAYGFCRTLLL